MSDAEEHVNRKPPAAGPEPTADMPGPRLEAGTQIGHFRIEGEIGRGGAGVVYLAHDTKLDRSVAIKSLPPEVKDNPKALTRFTREARVLASLNHPNIATIYDELEETEGLTYLVLEYVPGQTLAERIAKGPLKLEEALTIALQIAEAVAAAHEHDVIHRDLKPGNIKITQEAKVKVLDFGLAKVVGGETTDQQSTITEPGRAIGTPAYMSPEQARGKPTDKRCDIWSFGCVLFEMLTGRVPFQGETVSDTLANVLQKEPEWHALPESTPANMRSLLRHCLKKDPRRRLQHIGDAGIEIDETMSLPATELSQTRVVGASRRRIVRSSLMAMAAMVAGGILVFLALKGPPRPVREPWSFPLHLTPAPWTSGFFPEIALSPDGRQLVYMAIHEDARRLYVCQSRGHVRLLVGTEGAYQPFFSPDGKRVGFFAGGELKKLSLESGVVSPLCDAPPRPIGASWGSNDTIIFHERSLRYVQAAGGESKVLTELGDGERAHCWPDILPSGKAVLFTIVTTGFYDADIVVRNLQTGEQKIVVEGGSQPRYVPTGHVVYGRAGMLYALPFDLGRLEPTGPAFPLPQDVWMNERYGSAQFTFSRKTGTLAYVPGASEGFQARRMLVWVDRQGKVEPVPELPRRPYAVPRVSPDGRHVAARVIERGNSDIWVYNLQTGTPTRITSDPAPDRWPMWTPDSERVVFSSDREGTSGLFWRNRNGSDRIERLTTTDTGQSAHAWSVDGRTLVYAEGRPGELFVLEDVEDKPTPRPLLPPTPFVNEKWPTISPDGRWIAYVSDLTGNDEVYVRPFPDVESGRWTISTDGGNEPLWSPKGKELFYHASGYRMMTVSIETEPEFKPGKPEFMFDLSFAVELGRDYDISPDGQRFLFVKEGHGLEEDTELIVVQDWFDELLPQGKDQ
jgi:serine/threonine-protein kinase